MKKFLFLAVVFAGIVFGQNQFGEPIFNLESIINDPLDAKILNETKKENVCFREVEFTSEFYQGKPVRIYGIVAFPENAKSFPAIFWSQAGMSPANRGMPELFAKRGYVCMCVTLPHSIWNPNLPFNTRNPLDANMTHYAIAQMRAITYLAGIPEVDPEKIGIGGSSYGGFFSTLIAGADPRVKCGMSFFAGGNMEYGTHIPQFTLLETQKDVEIWNRTIDPALRLKYRKVPFLWGIAANDNWFYLPSVVKTYQESIGDKRMVIVPMWEHGFPEEIDEQLFSWFDVYLKNSRKPYNEVSGLIIKRKDNRLFASWSFRGENKVKKCELVISYGKISPWKWWIYRNHLVFPVKISGNSASCEIPVVEPGMEMLVYGNIIDENGFAISTVPVQIRALDFGIKKANCSQRFNLFQWKNFNEETKKNFERMGMTGFVFDSDIKMDNTPGIRIEPSKLRKPGEIRFKLHHVPQHSHIFKLWIRAEKKTEINVSIRAIDLPDANSKIVKLLRGDSAERPGLPVFTKTFSVDDNWKVVEVQCPYRNEDIEGYQLAISCREPVVYWISKIIFEPVWGKW